MSDISIGQIAVILVVALLVFGPERLPAMVKQAASFVNDLRKMVTNARRDLSDSVGDLGIDEKDLKTLADLRNPKSFVRQKVLDGVDLKSFGIDEVKEVGETLELPSSRTGSNGARRNGNGAASRARSTNGAGTTSTRTAKPVTTPPVDLTVASSTPSGARFDPDAT